MKQKHFVTSAWGIYDDSGNLIHRAADYFTRTGETKSYPRESSYEIEVNVKKLERDGLDYQIRHGQFRLIK